MDSYVIVGIPEEDDPVWKISSEKIPHITLLYLGDIENEPRALEFIEHVANTTLNKFWLRVDHRGELGDKKADVLFFSEGYANEKLVNLRANLLKNKDLFVAYNNVEQYSSWTPHLTLGYPETPAKSYPDNDPVHYVNFDRIALWKGDYDGPEFPLKNSARVYDEIAASSFSSPDEALVHFGIKGMKWGHRKAIPRSPNYSKYQRTQDIAEFGKRGSDRINRRIAKGVDVEKARNKESTRSTKQAFLIVGGLYAARVLAVYGPYIAQNIAESYVGAKTAATGAKAAANLFADTRGIGNHKIVDLGFNAATGVWG